MAKLLVRRMSAKNKTEFFIGSDFSEFEARMQPLVKNTHGVVGFSKKQLSQVFGRPNRAALCIYHHPTVRASVERSGTGGPLLPPPHQANLRSVADLTNFANLPNLHPLVFQYLPSSFKSLIIFWPTAGVISTAKSLFWTKPYCWYSMMYFFSPGFTTISSTAFLALRCLP